MNELSSENTLSGSVLKVADLVVENPKLEAELSLRRQRTRDGNGPRIKRRTLVGLRELFWSYVDMGATDSCWNYKRQIAETPMFRTRLGSWPVYRVAWLLHHGSIREDLLICHKCDNPRCCNPNHLFQGTYKDNMGDMVQKNRQSWGEKSSSSKLTENAVRDIRLSRMAGVPASALAQRYGVSKDAVWGVLKGRTWRHVA